MKSILNALTLAAAVLLPVSAAQAQTIIDFEDLGTTQFGTHMPDVYENLSWRTSDWHFLTSPTNPSNNYLALSGTATAVVRPGGADFYFEGATFWSRRGLDANGSFYFILYRDGATVYDGRLDPDGRRLFTAAPTVHVPNYTGPIDGWAVVFRQGGDDWNHLAMDDVQTRAIPTEPADLPLVTAPYTFSGQQSSTAVDATGRRSATYSGSIQSSAAGRIRGTLTFTVQYRVVDGTGISVGGRWSLTTSSKNSAPFTTTGEIATGSVLPITSAGSLAGGTLPLTFLSGDPAWPISADFNSALDSSRRPKLKGGFNLTYPVVP
ncbi:MAG: hypothetical protein J0M24_18735 [Verrucomicrobia bacterium]|nr:hypothetical protein [Verrucomicrobiota bacterium]